MRSSFTKLRIGLATLVVVAFLASAAYVIREDFGLMPEEFGLQVSMKTIIYRFHMKTFDLHNRLVKGHLELEFRPRLPEVDKPKTDYMFGPLVYEDGAAIFSLFGLNGRIPFWTFKLKRESTREKPAREEFEMQALGVPKLYPFDAYLLVGGAKCLIRAVDPNGEGKRLNTKEIEDVVVKLDIPGYQIRQARFHEVKGVGRKLETFEDEKLLFNSYWNNGSTFLLVLYRPLFLRAMTVVLGLAALAWVIYITLYVPLSQIPINTLGYFVALWTIRDILTRGITVFPTLVDYSVLLLFLALIAGIVAKVIWPKRA